MLVGSSTGIKRLWDCFSKDNFSMSFLFSITISCRISTNLLSYFPVDDSEAVNAHRAGLALASSLPVALESPDNGAGGSVNTEYTIDIDIRAEQCFPRPSGPRISVANDGRATKLFHNH